MVKVYWLVGIIVVSIIVGFLISKAMQPKIAVVNTGGSGDKSMSSTTKETTTTVTQSPVVETPNMSVAA